jgi:hypothetical protein
MMPLDGRLAPASQLLGEIEAVGKMLRTGGDPVRDSSAPWCSARSPSKSYTFMLGVQHQRLMCISAYKYIDPRR